MTAESWDAAYARTLMFYLNGLAIGEPDDMGNRIVDSDFLVLMNAAPEDIEFTLPPQEYGKSWTVCLDTDEQHVDTDFSAGDKICLRNRSVLVMGHTREEGEDAPTVSVEKVLPPVHNE